MDGLISMLTCKYLFSITKKYDNDISRIIIPLITDRTTVSKPFATTIAIQIFYLVGKHFGQQLVILGLNHLPFLHEKWF